MLSWCLHFLQMRGVTHLAAEPLDKTDISTHTPHARRDILQPQSAPTGKQFQLTRLMRGVTADEIKITGTIEFQLTRLMRGVTSRTRWMKFSSTISTHTPHARRDCKRLILLAISLLFQLTRLMRDVTSSEISHEISHENFNSHASCET